MASDENYVHFVTKNSEYFSVGKARSHAFLTYFDIDLNSYTPLQCECHNTIINYINTSRPVEDHPELPGLRFHELHKMIALLSCKRGIYFANNKSNASCIRFMVGIPIEFVTRRIKPVDNEELNAWRLLSHVIATRGDPELGHLIITSHDVFV